MFQPYPPNTTGFQMSGPKNGYTKFKNDRGVILKKPKCKQCLLSLYRPAKSDLSFLRKHLETTGCPLSGLHLTVVLLSPQVVGLLFSSQYGGSHQAAGSAHSGRHHGHQTLLLWPHHP